MRHAHEVIARMVYWWGLGFCRGKLWKSWWFRTVLGRTKCANFFVRAYCLWHKQLENEIILGGHHAPFFRKWVQTLLFSTYCKRRNFRMEFNFVAFVQLKNVRNKFPYQNFLPPGLQAFRSPLLVFTFFGQFDSTKLNSIRKVLDGKVRNFSPTKISSFTVL